MPIKITPVATRPSAPAPQNGSASPDKLARAKAAAAGQTVEAPVETQTLAPEFDQDGRRRLKMRTNHTPGAREYQTETIEAEPAAENVDNSVNNEQTQTAPEDKKPLSPQFAALMKKERALQVKEREIIAREEALKKAPQATTDAASIIERIKADPMGTILEHGGWDYQRLTELVLKEMEGGGPALTKVETEFRQQITDLKQSLEARDKKQADAQSDAEKSQDARLLKQAEHLVTTDENYLMIRETGSAEEVTELIKVIRKEEGLELSVKEAADMVEKDLLDESLKIARIPKVQSSLNPQADTARNSNDGSRRPMRTLTNRDSTTGRYTARERAIAAAEGRKLP